MTVFFTERRLQGELMDDPALDETEHVGALRGLARINAVSRTVAALWPTVVRVAAAQPGRCLTLLDVACGGGDVALALAARARRSKLALDVNGCDVSPIALRYAAGRAAEKALPVRFFRFDALADPIAAHYDIVVTTLFLHHLADEEIVALLTRLARHTDHLLVSDLLRGPLGYGLAWAGTRLLSTSPIVHVDGLRSVRAALSLSEVRRLIVEAGLADARITHSWPRRFLFYWTRPKTAPERGIHAA